MSTNLMSERISIHIIVPNLPRRSKTKNFLSIFCRLPPPPPPRKIRKVRKIFGFCSRDRRERTRRAHSLHHAIRAYDLVSSHHALSACDIICFENRFELGTINTPKRNSTAFSKPEGGTREARPTDFPPFFQTNSDSRLRRDGGVFR